MNEKSETRCEPCPNDLHPLTNPPRIWSIWPAPAIRDHIARPFPQIFHVESGQLPKLPKHREKTKRFEGTWNGYWPIGFRKSIMEKYQIHTGAALEKSLIMAGVNDAALEILCIDNPVRGSIRWLAIAAMSRFSRSSSVSRAGSIWGSSEPRAQRWRSSSSVKWLRRRWEWYLEFQYK